MALTLVVEADQEVSVDRKLINGAFKFDDDRSVVLLQLFIVYITR